jgi:hypothetical protein
VTYVLQLTNVPTAEAKPVLHLLNLETNEEVTVQHATDGTFSPDSKWIANAGRYAARRSRRTAGCPGSAVGGTAGARHTATTRRADSARCSRCAAADADHTGSGNAARTRRATDAGRSSTGRRRAAAIRWARRLLDTAAAAPRRAAQPRDRKDPILAGHRDVHVLAHVEPHLPQASPA